MEVSAVDIEILGDGAFAGSSANVVDYTVDEDASPLALNDLSGGVGGVTFSVVEDTTFDGSMLLPRQPFRLADPNAGSVRGIIDGGVGSDDVQLTVNASGVLLPLVSRRSMPAISGALGSILINWLTACGMGSVPLALDSELALIQLNLPSWEGEVWTQIKKLMAIHQFEMVAVDGTIVVRKLRQRDVDVTRYTSKRHAYGSGNSYQTVEVHYYNNQWVANTQVFPAPGASILETQIIQVNASETTTTNVPVGMWVSSIDAPEQVMSLPWNSAGVTESAYAVVDKDGRAVSLHDWENGGGYLSVEVGQDRKSIDITVRGMSTDSRAPYRIASSSQDGEYQFPALYIAATGVAFEKRMIWSPTGADLVDAPVDSVLTIDDPMVSTIGEAWTVLSNAVIRANGFEQTFEAETPYINRRGQVGTFLYPTFGDFNATIPGATFGSFNAANPSLTFEGFAAAQAALVAKDFANQAFGGMAGARVRERDCMYRIRGARATQSGFSWEAEFDTLFSDWDAEHAAANPTFGDFDMTWAGKTFEQFNRMPLYG